MPQQGFFASLHVCVQFPKPALCFSVCSTSPHSSSFSSSLVFTSSALFRCAAIQQSSYYRPLPFQHAHAKPTPARALATTGPLSALPAQVARRLNVAQSTPQPHAAATEDGGRDGKLTFLCVSLWFMSKNGSQVLALHGNVKSLKEQV